MVYNRTILVVSVCFAVLLLSVFFYLTGIQFLRAQLETHLGHAVGQNVDIKELNLNLSPVELRVLGTTIHRDDNPERPLAVLPEVTVRPELNSLFSGPWTLRYLEFSGPELILEESGDTGPVKFGGADSFDTTFFPVKIRRTHVRAASVAYFARTDTNVPTVRFEPITIRAGNIDDQTLREGVSVRARSGIDNGDGRLQFKGTTRITGGLRATGDVRVDRLSLTSVNSLVGPTVNVEEGRLSGNIPVDLSGDGVSTDTSTLRVDDARVEIGHEPEIKPETAPLTTADTVTSTQVETGSDTPSPFPVDLGEVRFEVLNSELGFSNRPELPALELKRATLLAGPVKGMADSFPLRAQLALGSPAGHLQMKGSVAPLVSLVGFEDFIGRFNVENVGKLNPYVKSVSPVKLKKGQLDAAVRGQGHNRKLDFSVELYFKGLQSGSVTSSHSTVVGIPVNLFVKYLKQNDGNLNLSFSVRGTPRRPVVDTTGIRTRILLNFGVDAAVIGTLGVPVYLGNEMIQRTSGIDLLGTARSTLGNVLGTNPSSPDPVFDLKSIDSE